MRKRGMIKTTVSAAIELPEHRYRLKKSDLMSEYYPETNGADRITIDHLLNNRSSLPHLNGLPD